MEALSVQAKANPLQESELGLGLQFIRKLNSTQKTSQRSPNIEGNEALYLCQQEQEQVETCGNF